ncbi:MAG TPA: hypothetical protein VFJ92_08855 [Gemmatimonadales bacterium]|nr:hypothetical protein [Gemmatimonadales bacterium]
MIPIQSASASPPTVGDTVWVIRTVELPAGRTVRPADWRPDDPVELLGPPRVVTRGGSADIAYPVVIWQTGPRTLEVPGPLLLAPNGGVDSLPPAQVTLQVASVLPAVPDSALRPQPRADFVPLSDRSPLVPLVLVTLAILLLLPLHWWWRRRGRPRPRPLAKLVDPARPPLERWADDGETRAVAAATSVRLRAVIAGGADGATPALDTDALLDYLRAHRPDWPLRELAELLRSLDQARFGVDPSADPVGLARQAAELEPRLRAEAA